MKRKHWKTYAAGASGVTITQEAGTTSQTLTTSSGTIAFVGESVTVFVNDTSAGINPQSLTIKGGDVVAAGPAGDGLRGNGTASRRLSAVDLRRDGHGIADASPLSWRDSNGRPPVMRKQFANPAGRLRGQALQHVPEKTYESCP